MIHDELIKSYREFFNTRFEKFIEKNYSNMDTLGKSIQYALKGEGKRVRPILTMLASHAFNGSKEMALPASLAIEMIHTYSLIHDDLPCMDDDDLRRGRPTTHKVFGEAEALLAGDAILTDAFNVLIGYDLTQLSDNQKLQQIIELSNAAGSRGMVWGQSQDLYWTAKQGGTEEDIDDIHLAKTGALMGSACAMGGIAGGASMHEIATLRQFGKTIGLAFQIFDDLLDDQHDTGKSQGKDKEMGKLTYLSFMNREEAQINAEQLTFMAIDSVEKLNVNAEPLIEFCRYLINRKS